jgi:2-polyprenyl-6-methoxyphenol hydroxylase-like FAD-dependent oxidoreductase
VNLAMLDGAELARALAEEATVDAAVTRYEAGMLPRSGEHALGRRRRRVPPPAFAFFPTAVATRPTVE